MQRRTLLHTLVGLAAAGSGRANEAPDGLLTWYEYDLPPISIVSGPQQDEGVNNGVRRRLVAGLPGYQHQVRVANFNRITEAMKNGETAACVGFQRNPEREAWMQFSLPFTIAMPNCAIVLESQEASMRARLDAEGRLPLEQALPTLKVGVAAGRSYGEQINQLLERHAIGGNVISRSGNNVSQGLLEMLQARRFDTALMFPEEAQYLMRHYGDKARLLSYPIKEAPPYRHVHVVVPKNAWGNKLLAQLNPLIARFRDSAEFHRERSSWLDDEARKRYKPLVAAMLRGE